jgi:hypothetical protein
VAVVEVVVGVAAVEAVGETEGLGAEPGVEFRLGSDSGWQSKRENFPVQYS